MKRWFVSLLVLLLLTGAAPAQAAPAGPQPPTGFDLVMEGPGVWLYRKDYANGAPDYVQVIDLAQGAALRLLHAPLTAERSGRGVYGGSDARFGLGSLENYWQKAQVTGSQAFCVANGQFFYMPETPTRLALPLKVDGQVLTEGFGYAQYDEKLMLELWGDHAEISTLTAEALYASDAPDILGGLPEDANKRAPHAVGRTFIGVDDWDADGQYEIVYLFATAVASQRAVAQVLRDFGAEKVMMLDGGGSTQLICQGKSLIPSERNIPQAIATFAGAAQTGHLSAAAWATAIEAQREPSPARQAAFTAWLPLAQAFPPIDQPQPEAPAAQPEQAAPLYTPRLGDLLLIPLLMLPVFLLFFALLKARA